MSYKMERYGYRDTLQAGSIMTDQEQLERFVRAGHPCISIVTHEEAYAMDVIRSVAGKLAKNLWVWSIIDGVHSDACIGGNPIKDTEHPAAALYYCKQNENKSVCVMRDLGEHLKDARTLRLCRDAIQRFADGGGCLILLDSNDSLPDVISSYATRMDVSFPDEKELEDLTVETLRRFHRRSPIEVELTKGQLKTIIRNLRGLRRRQARQVIIDAITDDHRFDSGDINNVLATKRMMLQKGGLLDFVEAPTDLSEIGGLANLKRWLEKRQNALTDEARSFGLERPRGVLMLGVQGAGKSLCAKAIATAWQRPLLRMDVGALYDKYIGESEHRLRDALRQAEMMAPIILWIDEIEKAFASAASQSTDGGLSKRMFGTLLTWMQEHREPVFLVATANDIEALPPELLRKGRFDEIFFVDLPKEDVRKQIFEIHLKKRRRDPKQFDLDKLAAASEGFSGAEIEQAVIAAMHDAFAEKTKMTTEGILSAIQASPPLSVTMSEKIHALKQWAKTRCVPAG
jgi:hypothetical protein